MDKAEARVLLEAFLDDLKGQTRDELARYIRNPECVTRSGRDGTQYQIEFESVWDSVADGDLRVIVSIDDGGFWSALKPMTDSFLISPAGNIVD